MRTTKGILFIAAMIAAAPALAERLVTGAPTEMRAGPDPLYLAEHGLRRGTAVDVLERNGAGWAVVRLPDGREGWVRTAVLALPGTVRPPVGAARARAKPTAKPVAAKSLDAPYTSVVWPSVGNLNLRSGPGTGFDVVRPMPRGDLVEVREIAGGWAKLRHPSGDEGWAYRLYLTR